MATIGLRELRQQASHVIRRVEAGETIVVTVSGRPAAQLVPLAPPTWRRAADCERLFDGPSDPDWDTDRQRLVDTPRDPWAASPR